MYDELGRLSNATSRIEWMLFPDSLKLKYSDSCESYNKDKTRSGNGGMIDIENE